MGLEGENLAAILYIIRTTQLDLESPSTPLVSLEVSTQHMTSGAAETPLANWTNLPMKPVDLPTNYTALEWRL